MGSQVGKTLDENFRKNQEFMVEMQRIQLERQIQFQNQMRERQLALQLSKTRELFNWLSSFYGVATFGMLTSYRRTKNSRVLVPVIPFTFILVYQLDLAYGTKLKRIRAEAENIIEYEAESLRLPNGVPSVGSIDQGRQKQQDDMRFNKVHELYI